MRERTEAVSRRTVVKGAAWSVPVMVGLAAAPAAVASGANALGANKIEWAPAQSGSFGKSCDGIHVYALARGIGGYNNPSTSTVVVTISVTNVADPVDTRTVSFSEQPLIVPAGWGSPSNQELLVISGLTDNATYTVVQTAVVQNANALPPKESQVTVSKWGC